MMAKKKPIESISSDDLGVALDSSSLIVNSQSPPPEKPAGQEPKGRNMCW